MCESRWLQKRTLHHKCLCVYVGVRAGGGTPHKPAVVGPNGHVIHESTSGATYLMNTGVQPGAIYKVGVCLCVVAWGEAWEAPGCLWVQQRGVVLGRRAHKASSAARHTLLTAAAAVGLRTAAAEVVLGRQRQLSPASLVRLTLPPDGATCCCCRRCPAMTLLAMPTTRCASTSFQQAGGAWQ